MVKKIAAAGAEGEKVAKVVPSQISRRFNKLRVKSGELDKKGIVYVGHLPKGFNEQELKKFFEQFGQVPKIRVSRSKKVPYNYVLNSIDCQVPRLCLFGILGQGGRPGCLSDNERLYHVRKAVGVPRDGQGPQGRVQERKS